MSDPHKTWADFLSNIVQLHSQHQTSETSQIIDRLSEGQSFYLITGHRTYLDAKLAFLKLPSLQSILRGLPEHHAIFKWAGSKPGALQLFKIDVQWEPPRSVLGQPKWYILWGPRGPDDKLWPPKPVKPKRPHSGSRTRTLQEIAELFPPAPENAPTTLKPNDPI